MAGEFKTSLTTEKRGKQQEYRKIGQQNQKIESTLSV